MASYTINFKTVHQQNGQPVKQRQKYVQPFTDGKDLLASVVSDFAPGHETVRLFSSDGNNVDIDLLETVKGLQAGAEVMGISQDSVGRTGVILVGKAERPIQQQQISLSGFSAPLQLSGQPATKAFKQGRIQTSDPAKSKRGQGTSKQLTLVGSQCCRFWARSLFSREPEAPWLFHEFSQQHLADLAVRGLLQLDELLGETHSKVVSALTEYMAGHNKELQKHHDNRHNHEFRRGAQIYASAPKQAQDWQETYGDHDWDSKEIPPAAWQFLADQGLDEETIKKVIGIKDAITPQRGSTADETTHFMPAGKQSMTSSGLQPALEGTPGAGMAAGMTHHGAEDNEEVHDWFAEDTRVLQSMQQGKDDADVRKREQQRATAQKRKEMHQETQDGAIDTVDKSMRQPKKQTTTGKEAAAGSGRGSRGARMSGAARRSGAGRHSRGGRVSGTGSGAGGRVRGRARGRGA